MTCSVIHPRVFLACLPRGAYAGRSRARAVLGRLTAILAVGCLIIGCNRQVPGPNTTPQPQVPGSNTTPQPQVSTLAAANTDLDKVIIPDSSVSGIILGRPFQPDQVTAAGNELIFRQGSRFWGDYREVRMSFAKTTPIREQLTVKIAEGNIAEEDDDPQVSVLLHSFQDAHTLTTQRAFGDGFALRVEFGKTDGGRLPGRLFFRRISDEGQTHTLSGTFTAIDVRNDAAGEPPGIIDAPYIYGLLTAQTKNEGRIAAGYFGRTDAGKELSNEIGSSIGQSDPPSGVGTLTNSPRVSYLSVDKEKICRVYHTCLEPGRYLVYSKRANVLANWRWMSVDAGTRQRLDLVVDGAPSGGLEVSVPKNPGPSDVNVVPLDEKGELPFPDESVGQLQLATTLGTSVPVRDGRANFESLPPGRYRAVAGKARRDIEVQAQKTVRVEVR